MSLHDQTMPYQENYNFYFHILEMEEKIDFYTFLLMLRILNL